jgi:AcrR family transcriptional regulator
VGLREVKAARTRDQIVDVAIELFVAQGYDHTTMEQIAEQAEVAPSTLYRYFPSKDLLLLDRLLVFTDLGSGLKSRPAGEPVGESLTVVIRDALESVVDDARHAALRRIIDETPAPRARLWDIAAEARGNLEAALAERMALALDDLRVKMAARIALQVFEIAAEGCWSGEHCESRADVLNDILTTLADLELILPTPLDRIA